ncbi:MAG TPA: four helix bundle protein [Sandaracinaceae bacterium LLY-WYZ-13_1]|nr:four helix bundle protein [Sandaracinaceae bacterium LLY-WYZ-13_1]
MHDHYRPTALDLLMDVMPSVKKLFEGIRSHDKNLAAQVRDAAASVILNHAEANGSDAGNARARVYTAYGSLWEVRKGLLLAAAWDYVDADEVRRVEALLDRASAMTYRRLHPKR